MTIKNLKKKGMSNVKGNKGMSGVFERRGMSNVKRGMSPVVATMLLIALVIVIAVIIFIWLRSSFVPEILEKNGEDVSLVCGKVDFRAVYSDDTKNLEVSNDGNYPIQDFNIQIYTLGTKTETNLRDISTDNAYQSYGLGKSRVLSTNVVDKPSSTNSITNAETIIVTPILRGSSDNGGYQDRVCDVDQYGKEIKIE